MSAYSVRGGPHAGIDHADAESELQDEARRIGARSFAHDADGGVYTFVIEATTAPLACIAVTGVFRPVYGRSWWAEVASTRGPS